MFGKEGSSVCVTGSALPPHIFGWQWGRGSEVRKAEQGKERLCSMAVLAKDGRHWEAPLGLTKCREEF